MTTGMSAQDLKRYWEMNPRWQGVVRPYGPEDVVRLRGTVQVEHTLARIGAEKLWRYMQAEHSRQP